VEHVAAIFRVEEKAKQETSMNQAAEQNNLLAKKPGFI
jgi:hypothetical protein